MTTREDYNEYYDENDEMTILTEAYSEAWDIPTEHNINEFDDIIKGEG